MRPFRRHPYALLLGGAAVVLLFIALGAAPRAKQEESAQPVALGGEALRNPGIYSPSLPAPSEVPENSPPSTLRLPALAPSNAVSPAPARADSFDASSLLSLLSPSQNASPAATTQASDLLREAYGPLVSAGFSAPSEATPHTTDQLALYAYGNEAGRVVKRYEETQGGFMGALSDWMQDRNDSSARVGVLALSRSLAEAGEALSSLSDVPEEASAGNAALAQSYRELASKLDAAVSTASDQALAEALKAYDASADEFTRRFLALVDLFSFNGVTFTLGDPGSVFTKNASGL